MIAAILSVASISVPALEHTTRQMNLLGYPDFDTEKAARHYKAVNWRVLEIISDTIERWDPAGIFQ